MSFSTPTAKYGALITTVDPSQNLIEGVLKSGKAVQINVFDVPIVFRWPVVGESWMVRQENGNWMLDGAWANKDAVALIFDADPGDLILTAPSGVVRVIGSDGTSDFTITKQVPPSWITVVGGIGLQNLWTAGAVTPAYAKDTLGTVRLRGSVISGTSATTAFTLPVGFRPGVSDYYPALQSAGAAGAFVYIDTGGNVQPTRTGTNVYLNGLSFLAEN